ncbi:MAG TPA: DNA mismatch repair endonuclease MutL [Thermomicrobiales bacterium]
MNNERHALSDSQYSALSTQHSALPHIALLPPAVAERIAAGEVIETPAAVVKELVENALDAGARQIIVEVRGGGLESIRVTDDGGGIVADEVSLAFQRHATSKLRALDDLLRVRTLGFRGEALPSITAVADVLLHTATDGASAGMVLHLQHGAIIEQSKRARSRGTTVTVRDLFAAFPARRRFLRTPRVEAQQIGQTVRRFALAHPAVTFTLAFDGHTAFHTPGNGALADAAAALYGPAVAAHLLPLTATVSEGTIAGVIGDRAVSRPSRAAVTLIVNGRCVKCPPLAAAFETAYRPLLPRGRHPLAVLHLTVPPDTVDVNIHPAKAEVRLLHTAALGVALAEACRATLGRLPTLPPDDADWSFLPTPPTPSPTGEGEEMRDMLSLGGMRDLSAPTAETTVPESNLPALRIVGQLEERLILAEGADGLYLVDQHRAHERVIYEHLRARTRHEAAQEDGIEPLVLALSPADARRLTERMPDLAAVGVTCEAWGRNTFLLRSLPAELTDADGLGPLLLDALAEADDYADDGTDAWRDRLCTALACRSALRRGSPLSPGAMHDLLRRLGATDSPTVCPHGSPIVLHVGSGFLVRQFGWD